MVNYRLEGEYDAGMIRLYYGFAMELPRDYPEITKV